MSQSLADTIFALSTAPGRGAVAVIRVSGPSAHLSLQALTNTAPPVPRQSAVRLLKKSDGTLIDSALILSFKGPHSFTGEDVVEYHVHGGWSVIQTLLASLAQFSSHRMALPGEFTRRAFEHGKLDLTEAEAVADLIDAETELQRLQALNQLGGSLEQLYRTWTDRLARLLALMEADLDFSDQDLPDDLLVRVRPDLTDLVQQITEHLDDNRRGERLRNGFRIVILGAPNAGKSSLVNALAQRDLAIVSPVAGTTRDVVEAHLDLGGYPVIISDTAGLRTDIGTTGHDGIEAEGIRRALDRAGEADLKLLVFDGTLPQDEQTLRLVDETSIVVSNKSDLSNNDSKADGLRISTKTNLGLDTLLEEIRRQLEKLVGQKTTPTLTRARHREALRATLEALERSMRVAEAELAAEDIRLAVRHLGSITGRVDVEDLLDMIFRDFCIGK